jgi:CheY-like chemotaxis protein
MSYRGLNIILVDDDDVDVMNVQRAFKKGQIQNPIFVASDGVAALELLRSDKVPADRRLVLLDLNMPRMNGIELLRELRADPRLRATPVVVLTTSNDERDKVEAYQLNVAGYLLKPVTFGAFVELMDALNTYWSTAELPPPRITGP